MTPVTILAALVIGAAVAWAGFCAWAWLKIADFYEHESGD